MGAFKKPEQKQEQEEESPTPEEIVREAIEMMTDIVRRPPTFHLKTMDQVQVCAQLVYAAYVLYEITTPDEEKEKTC